MIWNQDVWIETSFYRCEIQEGIQVYAKLIVEYFGFLTAGFEIKLRKSKYSSTDATIGRNMAQKLRAIFHWDMQVFYHCFFIRIALLTVSFR